MKEYCNTRTDDDPNWPPMHIINISGQKVYSPLCIWVYMQRHRLKSTKILMQNNEKVDQKLKERVEKLDVEVDGWLWDATENTYKERHFHVSEYSMIDGESVRKFESILQITETYEDINNDSAVSQLINGTIMGNVKGTEVPKVTTHVSGRIFRRSSDVPPSMDRQFIDQQIAATLDVPSNRRNKYIYCLVQVTNIIHIRGGTKKIG